MINKPIFKDVSAIPSNAVLLIPEPENENGPAAYGVKAGYYDSKQMLELVERHRTNSEATHYIADMLETGDSENDEFAVMLRKNCRNQHAIAQIVKLCRE